MKAESYNHIDERFLAFMINRSTLTNYAVRINRPSLVRTKLMIPFCLMFLFANLCIVNFGYPATDAGSGWLVILGSFPQSQAEEAIKRQSFLKSRGLDAKIETSRQYSTLVQGYLIIVLGPYSKSVALQVLDNTKTYISDAYIKFGAVADSPSVEPEAPRQGPPNRACAKFPELC